MTPISVKSQPPSVPSLNVPQAIHLRYSHELSIPYSRPSSQRFRSRSQQHAANAPGISQAETHRSHTADRGCLENTTSSECRRHSMQRITSPIQQKAGARETPQPARQRMLPRDGSSLNNRRVWDIIGSLHFKHKTRIQATSHVRCHYHQHAEYRHQRHADPAITSMQNPAITSMRIPLSPACGIPPSPAYSTAHPYPIAAESPFTVSNKGETL